MMSHNDTIPTNCSGRRGVDPEASVTCNIPNHTAQPSSIHLFGNLHDSVHRSNNSSNIQTGVTSIVHATSPQRKYVTPNGDEITPKNTLQSFDVTITGKQTSQAPESVASVAAMTSSGTSSNTAVDHNALELADNNNAVVEPHNTNTSSSPSQAPPQPTMNFWNVVQAELVNSLPTVDADLYTSTIGDTKGTDRRQLNMWKKYGIIILTCLTSIVVSLVVVIVLFIENGSNSKNKSADINDTGIETPTRSSSTSAISPITSSPAPTVAPTVIPDPSLQVACDFLQYPSLSECKASNGFAGATHGLLVDSSFGFATIPTEIGMLTQFVYLNLYWQYLSGSIPTTIGDLTLLESLDLSSNSGMTGTIPETLANLKRLGNLDLSRNGALTGTIPEALGNLSLLYYLDLSSNNLLSGTIPQTLGKLQLLEFLDLSDNTFTNTIPPTLSDLTSLKKLNLSENQFGGTVPSSFGKLTMLEHLWLHNNPFLGGSIPAKLCSNSIAGKYNNIHIDCGSISCDCCRSGLYGQVCT